MNFKKWRAGRSPALPLRTVLPNGLGIANILFGNLMVPVYAADALGNAGIDKWQLVLMAAVANVSVAIGALILAVTGWQPSSRWVSAGMALAAAGLFVPLKVPERSGSFVPLATAGLAIYGLAAGLAHFTGQTAAVDAVGKSRRSGALARIMRFHLPFGLVLGGLPAFFSWRVGEWALVVAFVLLAVAVAVRNDPGSPTGKRMGLRELSRDTGAGAWVLAIGQAAWVVMYIIPALHPLTAAQMAVCAAVAQTVAFCAMALLERVVDRNQVVTATISGCALLFAILGVVIFPAIFEKPAENGVVFFFVLGETVALALIAAVGGHLSLEPGAARSQLFGHAITFAVVALAVGLVAFLAWLLTGSAVWAGSIIVALFSIAFVLSAHALRTRQRRSARVTEASLAGAPALWVGEDPTRRLTKLVVVCVAGSGLDKELYRSLLTRLARTDVNAVAIDIPGLGAAAGSTSLFDQGGRRIGEVLDELSTRWRWHLLAKRRRARFVLVGHSTGCAQISTYHAGRHDRSVVGNYLLAPVGMGDLSPEMRERLDGSHASEIPARCNWEQLGGTSVAVFGTDDEEVPLKTARAIPAGVMLGDLLIGGGHTPRTEWEYDLIAESLERFLQHIKRTSHSKSK